MRTKTLLLSALLGTLGSVSVHAQSVYSLNAVGYINVTFPPNTYTILTCPLVGSPDNTLNSILSNTNGQYIHAQVIPFANGAFGSTEVGVKTAVNATGWSGGGVTTLSPGQAAWFYNPNSTNMTATFVGTVVSGPATNVLIPGYNMVGSIVPASGDIVTNSITGLTNVSLHDFVFQYDPIAGYGPKDAVVKSGLGTGYNNEWTSGDPVVPNVYDGFWYWNNALTNNNWVENYSVGN
jgi:hypothetical protein